MRIIFLACLISLVAGKTNAQHREPGWMHPPRHRSAPAKPAVRAAYKPRAYRNVVTVNTAATMFDDFGAMAAGAEYEHFLNSSGRISVAASANVFVAAGFPKLAESGGTVTRSGYSMLPALLFHPAGNARFTDYSFGIAPGFISFHTIVYDYTMSGESRETKKTDQTAAILAQANLVQHHTNRFVFGFHASGGYLVGAERHGGIFQFGLKLGRRF